LDFVVASIATDQKRSIEWAEGMDAMAEAVTASLFPHRALHAEFNGFRPMGRWREIPLLSWPMTQGVTFASIRMRSARVRQSFSSAFEEKGRSALLLIRYMSNQVRVFCMVLPIL
jgi:hypothetical protein